MKGSCLLRPSWVFLTAAACLVVLSCSSSTGVDGDVAEDDGISPSGVSDLAVIAFTNDSATLTWTAPGDDSTSGTASCYDVRYSFRNDLWSDWDSAEVVDGTPPPKPAGSAESLTVAGLFEDSTYYFAVRARDEADNWSFVSNVVSATCYNDFTVVIPDANLEAAIRQSIGKPTGDILRSDLMAIETLESENMGIEDLSGLEYCAKMYVLIIPGNSIEDLGPLSALTGLRSLNAGYNQIADISSLSGLTTLEQLTLSENMISDIAPLDDLAAIQTLRLQRNLLTDISALEDMPKIEFLDLSWNALADIGPLAANSGLSAGDEIYLNVNPLSFQSVTVHIPALQARGVEVHWDVDDTPPGSVSDLLVAAVSDTSATLTWTAPGDDGIWGKADAYDVRYGTDSLEVSNWDDAAVAPGAPAPQEAGATESMKITGLETGLEYYFALKARDESNNWSAISNLAAGIPFVDVVVVIPDAGLEAAIREAIGLPTGDIYKTDLFSLMELEAAGRGVEDLTGLENCVNLAVLDLQDNVIQDIAALGSLTRLADLNLDRNALSDISPLAGVTGLQRLSLRGNVITDIGPLAGLRNLEYLFCSSNSISDLSPLSGLSNLFFFEAQNNHISDISPLSGLALLWYLFLSINQIDDLGPLAGLAGLRYVYADYNLIGELEALSNLPNIEKISVRFNQVTDIAPLVANVNLASGDEVSLQNNPLSQTSIDVYVPALQARGVTVHY